VGADVERGPDEGEPPLVDVVGMRLHGPRDEHHRARREAGELVDLERDAFSGEPCGEALLVSGVAGHRAQTVEDRAHVAFVTLPSHVGRRELHEWAREAAGEHARGVGAEALLRWP
jgi:hypothetical protein